MKTMNESGVSPVLTTIGRSSGHRTCSATEKGAFPALNSTASDAQKYIQSHPDAWFVRQGDPSTGFPTGSDSGQGADKILKKAGNLLVTASQNAKTGRLTAIADKAAFVANGWLPVPTATVKQAKALAVFINSTPGRLQLMQNASRTLAWPLYRPAGVKSIRIPDPSDERIMGILADCWERTKDMEVPTFGEGECEVRRLWDEAVAEAMGWDAEELGRLRNLLHKEPHVSGVRYGHYS